MAKVVGDRLGTYLFPDEEEYEWGRYMHVVEGCYRHQKAFYSISVTEQQRSREEV